MWEYASSSSLLTRHCATSDNCVWCSKPLGRLDPAHFELEASPRKLIVQASICLYCGWWTAFRVHHGYHPETAELFECYEAAIGSLKEFDLSDISAPLSEVRKYLQARKEKVFDMHPKLFEDTVGSVFKDFGYSIQVTAYSGDDGLDVILGGSGGKTVGVQVKRHKRSRKIEAEQIRAFAGALVLNGLTEGVFVTTSSYRRGAKETAKLFGGLGYPIRLLDCKGFFDALEIAQLKQFDIKEDFFAKAVLSQGAYLGSGNKKPFVEKENIYSRQIISSVVCPRDEFIDLREEQIPHFK